MESIDDLNEPEITLAKPHKLSISSIISLLEKHFTKKYPCSGAAIESEVLRIQQIHGCQVIVNGVYSTLRYYLRLLPDTAEFVDRYVELIKADPAVKYQQRAAWNECVAGIQVEK
jgi:hypothetical protein